MYGIEIINLRAIGNYSISLSDSQLKFSLICSLSEEVLFRSSDVSRWIYISSGHGEIKNFKRQIISVTEQNLVYLPPHEEISIFPILKTSFEIVVIEVPNYGSDSKKEVITFSKSNKNIDWFGPWISQLSTTTIHLALTGNDNSKVDKPLHFHRKTIEAYYVAHGSTTMMIRNVSNKVILSEGHLLIVKPGVPHGMDLKEEINGVVNYAGLVVKIPTELITPVDPNDKFASDNDIRYNQTL